MWTLPHTATPERCQQYGVTFPPLMASSMQERYCGIFQSHLRYDTHPPLRMWHAHWDIQYWKAPEPVYGESPMTATSIYSTYTVCLLCAVCRGGLPVFHTSQLTHSWHHSHLYTLPTPLHPHTSNIPSLITSSPLHPHTSHIPSLITAHPILHITHTLTQPTLTSSHITHTLTHHQQLHTLTHHPHHHTSPTPSLITNSFTSSHITHTLTHHSSPHSSHLSPISDSLSSGQRVWCLHYRILHRHTFRHHCKSYLKNRTDMYVVPPILTYT